MSTNADFDTWKENQYTKVLEQSIANDYLPKHAFRPVGYINELDKPVLCEMTAQKLDYCKYGGMTILYRSEP